MTGAVKGTEGRRCWMGDLPSRIKASPLCSVSIPGSHDSFTYSLEQRGGAGPDQPPCIRALTRRFPTISSWLLYRWSVTQRRTVSEQLEAGVRYLDIRLQALTEQGEREFRVLHCLLGERVTTLLAQIKLFLLQNKSEVVILDFHHLYQFEPRDHERLTQLLLTMFRGLLCSWQQDTRQLSIASMGASGARLIVIYPAIYQHRGHTDSKIQLYPGTQEYFWPRTLCPTPWPDREGARSSYLQSRARPQAPGSTSSPSYLSCCRHTGQQ